jgi:SAM-dependent methyltransferase
MQARLVEHLACPVCAGELALIIAETVSDGVETGTLRCTACGASFPIERGIPRLAPSDLSTEQRRTAAAFGWQWQHFREMTPRFEEQFLDWIAPLGPPDFRDRLVLDAGCGIGRHAYFAAKYGARDVIAMDLSDAVETAKDVLAEFPNAHVVQGDLLRPPFRRDPGAFDLVYSIGVIHHLPDPPAGIRSLGRTLAPDGTLAVWVYGYENNGFVRHAVESLRRVSTKLDPSVMRGLAWPLAVAFHGAVKWVYRPLSGTRVGDRLPLHEYLSSLAGFGFRQNYTIVFDQLVAPTAVYVKRDELQSWLEDARLEDVTLTSRRANSWRGRGRAPASQPVRP